ncbi:MAG: acyl-CoA synthetase [Burkholderiaceae bacterium]
MNFDAVNREYSHAREHFTLSMPEHYNFAYDVIDRIASESDGTAVIAMSRNGEDIRHVAYSDLAADSSRFANALFALGLKPGDHACVVIGRIPAWYTVLFGCMKAGVVSMPGTNLLTGKDIAYRINRARARMVVVTPEHCDKINAIRAECPTLEHLITVGEAPAGWESLEALCAQQAPEIPTEKRLNTRSTDPMMAYFTSGTTSLPKMVPRDFGYGLAQVVTGLFWIDNREGDVHWTLTDTGWAKAAWGMLFAQFTLKSPIVLYDGEGAFDADFHLRMIAKLKVKTFCAPPTVYRLFAQLPLENYDLSSIRRSLSAGEPLNPEVIRVWEKATGTVIADGYGQTETVNIVGNFPNVEVRYGSMGQAVPGFDIDVVDDHGERLPTGEVGHIAIKLSDPWPAGLFHGYQTDDDPDMRSFHDGWYFTGDTASRDEDGYFWFVGRADDLISSAGYRISPFEVESSLLEHPAVAESAVVGKPDATRGEIVKAFITLASGYSPSDALVEEIQTFCKSHTAPYKYPREIEFVDSLPKTISGKIRRVELRGRDAD